MPARKKPPAQEAQKDTLPTVEAGTLAQLFGLTPTRISQLGKAGTLPKAKERGRYLLWPSIKNYIAALKNPKLNAHGTADGTEDPETLRGKRERKLDLECDKLQHQIKVMEGEYVTRESQIRDGMATGEAIKALVLKIPSDLPQMIIGLDYPDAVARCEDYAYQILTSLAEAREGVAP